MRAWLTPDAATGDYACRRFSIPVELLHIVTGAIETLTHASSFEQQGTMTPDEAAALMLEMFNSYLTSTGECMNDISMIGFFFGANPSSDWLLCDGAPHDRIDYPYLYDSLNDVGSDLIIDADTFRVPNLVGNFVLGTDEAANQTGGAATHTLTTGEMPAHTHSVNNPGVVNVQPGVGATPHTGPGLPTVTGSTGGGGAHNNMPPYITATPYIKAR